MKKNNFKPMLECLEDRLAPAAFDWSPQVGSDNATIANNWYLHNTTTRPINAPTFGDAVHLSGNKDFRIPAGVIFSVASIDGTGFTADLIMENNTRLWLTDSESTFSGGKLSVANGLATRPEIHIKGGLTEVSFSGMDFATKVDTDIDIIVHQGLLEIDGSSNIDARLLKASSLLATPGELKFSGSFNLGNNAKIEINGGTLEWGAGTVNATGTPLFDARGDVTVKGNVNTNFSVEIKDGEDFVLEEDVNMTISGVDGVILDTGSKLNFAGGNHLTINGGAASGLKVFTSTAATTTVVVNGDTTITSSDANINFYGVSKLEMDNSDFDTLTVAGQLFMAGTTFVDMEVNGLSPEENDKVITDNGIVMGFLDLTTLPIAGATDEYHDHVLTETTVVGVGVNGGFINFDIGPLWKAYAENNHFRLKHKPGSPEGYVFEDKNENGVKDAGEPGLETVPVNLYDGYDVWLDSVFTDSTGKFEFSGEYDSYSDYYVTFRYDADDTGGAKLYATTTVISLGSDDWEVHAQTAPFEMKPGTTTVDSIGIWIDPKNASIWGYVVEDDGDGILNGGENSFSGVYVDIFDIADETRYIDSVQTDINGKYTFANLNHGQYRIEIRYDDANYYISPAFQGNDPTEDVDFVQDLFDDDLAITALTLDVSEEEDYVDLGLTPVEEEMY